MQIDVHKATQEELESSRAWPMWAKSISQFPWHYDEREVCVILEGSATVTPRGGDAVTCEAGDVVEFPAGMDCVWHITQDLKKRYRFDRS